MYGAKSFYIFCKFGFDTAVTDPNNCFNQKEDIDSNIFLKRGLVPDDWVSLRVGSVTGIDC